MTLPAYFSEVLGCRNPDGGFPYLKGGKSAVEPTLLMLLGLLAQERPEDEWAVSREWLLKQCQPDGGVGYSPVLPSESRWLTAPFAIAAHQLKRDKERDEAVAFLLKIQPLTFEPHPEVDLDSRIPGWPWVDGTFSWIEPTSWAILALSLAGRKSESRVTDGKKLIKDRCIPNAGWNYGNKAVYNAQLIPFWDTTALALLALGPEEREFCRPVLEVIKNGLSLCESSYSLALTSISLSCFGEPVGGWNEKLQKVIEALVVEEINVGHFGLALAALGTKRVFTP